MRLIALETLRIDGKKFVCGEVFETSDELGEILKDRGVAREDSSGVDKTAYGENEIDLDALTVDELKALAKEHGLKGYSKLNKEELVEILFETLGGEG